MHFGRSSDSLTACEWPRSARVYAGYWFAGTLFRRAPAASRYGGRVDDGSAHGT